MLDSCSAAYTALGPGLLESVYEEVLAYELKARSIACERQVEITVWYMQVRLYAGFRADIPVERK